MGLGRVGSDEDEEILGDIILGVWVLKAPGSADRTDMGILHWAWDAVCMTSAMNLPIGHCHAGCAMFRPSCASRASYHPDSSSLAKTQLVGAQISSAGSLSVNIKVEAVGFVWVRVARSLASEEEGS